MSTTGRNFFPSNFLVSVCALDLAMSYILGIKIQVTRVSELNLGHHIIKHTISGYRTKIMTKISTKLNLVHVLNLVHTTALGILQTAFI